MAKHKCRKRIAAVRMGETPTRERRRQNGGVATEVTDRRFKGEALTRRYRAVWGCPLDAYRDHQIITEPQHRAGIRFKEAYYSAVLSRQATSERLNRYPTPTGLTMSEKLIKDAYNTLSSHNMETVIDVCGHGQVVWSHKAAESLRKGLGHLAVRWHMMAIETCEHKRK
jgi:hypothetical protein